MTVIRRILDWGTEIHMLLLCPWWPGLTDSYMDQPDSSCWPETSVGHKNSCWPEPVWTTKTAAGLTLVWTTQKAAALRLVGSTPKAASPSPVWTTAKAAALFAARLLALKWATSVTYIRSGHWGRTARSWLKQPIPCTLNSSCCHQGADISCHYEPVKKMIYA